MKKKREGDWVSLSVRIPKAQHERLYRMMEVTGQSANSALLVGLDRVLTEWEKTLTDRL